MTIALLYFREMDHPLLFKYLLFSLRSASVCGYAIVSGVSFPYVLMRACLLCRHLQADICAVLQA